MKILSKIWSNLRRLLMEDRVFKENVLEEWVKRQPKRYRKQVKRLRADGMSLNNSVRKANDMARRHQI